MYLPEVRSQDCSGGSYRQCNKKVVPTVGTDWRMKMGETTEHVGHLAMGIVVALALMPLVVYLFQNPLSEGIVKLMAWVM